MLLSGFPPCSLGDWVCLWRGELQFEKRHEAFMNLGIVPKTDALRPKQTFPENWLGALLTIVLGFAAFLGIAGCSTSRASSATQTPLISVAMTLIPPTSMVVGNSTPVSATVTNDIANAGVDWVATCASP